MAEPIPLSVPSVGKREKELLEECVNTNWVSSAGPFVDLFEETVAEYVGAQYGIATSTGTAALHVALRVSGVEKNDEVLVPALTFIAPANAVRYLDAHPVFIDAQPDHWQIDPGLVKEFLSANCEKREDGTYNRSTGRRVRALLPVHVLGHPVELDSLREVARSYNLSIIEDAAESFGAKYKGRRVGGGPGMVCLSFNGNKTVTTGGGGMLLTDREDWARKARYLTTQAKDDPLEYVHETVGYNYRLSNLQAALGCAQMERLEVHIQRKRSVAKRYQTALSDKEGLRVFKEAPWAHSTYWLSAVEVDSNEYGVNSRTLIKKMRAQNILVRPLWNPLHLNPAHAGETFVGNGVARQLNRRVVCLPSSPSLTDRQQDRVIELLLHI